MTTTIERKEHNGKAYQVAHGTFYHVDTPSGVIEALEAARATGDRIRLFYGKGGKSWHEENDVTGAVGRSMGPVKTPLLIANSRHAGGAAILDHCVIAILGPRGWLYKPEGADLGRWETKEAQGGFWVSLVDGEHHARHTSEAKAKRYADFMTGKRLSR